MNNSSSLSEKEIKAIQDALKKDKKPTIGLVGVSGVGKTSTINKMFKTHLPVSATIACTKNFETIDLELSMNQGIAKGQPIELTVVDAPGLAEDIKLDSQYLEMYHQHLPNCDVILYVLAARNRAIALDQMYLEKLKSFHQNMVFAINQVDLLDPMEWNEKINLPSDHQLANIQEVIKDRTEKLESVVEKEINLIAYSSKTGYNLQELFSSLLDACPPERKWLFQGLKSFHFTDFIPKETLAHLRQQGLI